MNWNFLQCLDATEADGALTTSECDIGGHTRSQRFSLGSQTSLEDPGAELQWNGGTRCAAPEQEAEIPAPCDTRLETVLESGDTPEALDTFQLHTLFEGDVDGGLGSAVAEDEKEITADDAHEPVHGSSASGDQPGVGRVWVCYGQEGAGGSLHACAKGQVPQRFRSTPVLGGYEIRLEAPEKHGEHRPAECLDGADGAFVPRITKCAGDSGSLSARRSQVWQIEEGQLVWEGITKHHQPHHGWMRACLHVGATEPSFRHLGDVVRPALRTCADKKGQRLRRDDARDDGSFLLRDADTGECLGRSPDEGAGGAVVLGDCDESQRWREVPEKDQVLHVASDLCIDAGDEKTPVLYQCHGGRTQRKQQFNVVESPFSLRLRPAWEDNGRRRFFELCVDWAPARLKRVIVQPCRHARIRQVRWETLSSHVPYETRLWQQAKKPGEGDPVLGGDAAPPS